MSKFDNLIKKILLEQNIVPSSVDMNFDTSYDTAVQLVKALMSSPRKLLPPVDLRKYIKPTEDSKGFQFNWRFGSKINTNVQITGTPGNVKVVIFDTENDNILFDSENAPSPDVTKTFLDKANEIYDKAEKAGTKVPAAVSQTPSELPQATEELPR